MYSEPRKGLSQSAVPVKRSLALPDSSPLTSAPRGGRLPPLVSVTVTESKHAEVGPWYASIVALNTPPAARTTDSGEAVALGSSSSC